jgi:TolB-like protein/DNA-binding winged helix-turn-helix (wHTH) protein
MSTFLRFDCFEVDLAAGHLFKRGARIHLREQSFQVLVLLLERPGEVVTREALRLRLWSTEVFVDFENNLNAVVARLREALGDSAERPRFIETLPKRGYRFLGTLSGPVPASRPMRGPRPRVLVLPFVNLTGDRSQEYVSDAMTDEVITELAALAPDALAVIARTTAMRYKGTQKDVARIGRELKVDYVVEGAVRHVGESVTVNAQLVRASDQAHVFAKRYEADPKEIFGVQGRIARDIAEHLGAAAGIEGGALGAAAGGRAPRKPTDDLVAYHEYVQGLHDLDHMGAGSMDYGKARSHLERALARDPGFGPAHEALAQVYWILGYAGVSPPKDAFAAGILHAVRALEIDNTRAEAHALIAQFHKQLEYDWPDIERRLVRALELNPTSPLVRMLYAVGVLMPQGRLAEAIAELDRALEWDPLSYQVHFWRAIMLSLAREPDRVIDQAGVLIDLEPGNGDGPWLLGVALSRKGLFDEAIAAVRRAVDLSGGAAVFLGWLGLILGVGGRVDEARGVLSRLEVMSRTAYVPPASIAWVHLGLRDVDRAFEWLARAVDAHDQLMMPIKSYAFFDPLRADPRFHALLRKMKLEP